MTTTTRLADLHAAHADLRDRYHAISAELTEMVDACHRGEVAEDAAWYAAVDALIAEREQNIQRDEAMRPEIHQLTREQSEADDDAEIVPQAMTYSTITLAADHVLGTIDPISSLDRALIMALSDIRQGYVTLEQFERGEVAYTINAQVRVDIAAEIRSMVAVK